MKGIYNWMGRHVHAPYGPYIFSLLIFIEGFFIIPSSTLLAFCCLQNRNKSFLYGTLATLFSGLGALAGYGIGMLVFNSGFNKFISILISQEKLNYVMKLYTDYQFWTVFIAALTPLPFKVLTISAGYFKLSVYKFILFTLMARGLRFYLISLCIYIFGDKFNYFISKYFYYLMFLGIILFALMFWIVH